MNDTIDSLPQPFAAQHVNNVYSISESNHAGGWGPIQPDGAAHAFPYRAKRGRRPSEHVLFLVRDGSEVQSVLRWVSALVDYLSTLPWCNPGARLGPDGRLTPVAPLVGSLLGLVWA